jgi:serine/threonine-protein kinase HipA
MRKAAVYLRGEFVGELTEASRNEYIFRYDNDYFKDSDKPDISILLNKSQQEYRSGYLFPFFFNMLSEGSNRLVQSRMLGIDENDHFGILLATAQHDVIGAVTVKPI